MYNIFLFGLIDNDKGEEIVRELSSIKKETTKAVSLFIKSEGGDVATAASIIGAINKLKKDKIKITTIAMGECCSMAAIIFMHGDRRLVYEGCYFMIHKCQYATDLENVDILLKSISDFSNYYDFILAKALENTNLKVDYVKEKFANVTTVNWNLTDGELLEYKVAHEII